MEDIEGNAEELARLQADQDATQREIDQMVAALEEQRRQEEAANNPGGGSVGGGGSVTGTGSFGWPVPSCTYITSKYGPRYHPVTGVYQSTHTGLDIGAAYGATIVASDGGTVTCAGVKGGYGSCVMIDHGNGYYTLYGHMSSISVSLGQSVSKGDTIGYVGDSGITTGPHLHFEIRVNGVCTDPAPWFSGLSYAPDA